MSLDTVTHNILYLYKCIKTARLAGFSEIRDFYTPMVQTYLELK